MKGFAAWMVATLDCPHLLHDFRLQGQPLAFPGVREMAGFALTISASDSEPVRQALDPLPHSSWVIFAAGDQAACPITDHKT